MSLLSTLEAFCYKSHAITNGRALLKEGEHSAATYVLISGSFQVTAGNVDIGTFCQPGDSFGEMAALLGDQASADVIAMEDSKVYEIKDLNTLLLKNPELAVEMLKASYIRLKQMNKGVTLMREMINR